MTGDRSDSVVIPLSRRYTILLVVFALLLDPFALFGMLALSTTGIVGTVIAVVGSSLLAVVTLEFVIQLVMARWFGLRLDPQGFTVRMNLGSRRYRWKDVEHFFLYHTVALHPVVVFKYRGKAEVHGIQSTRGLLGTFDGSLPQNLAVRGRALLDLMEQWRLRRAPAAVIAGAESAPS